MASDLILGTAGHIDHGKTALVKTLTGIDCDRLPEEKKRGITIDIGFAHLELPGHRLGIVDVPGHERFIKNMLAGATGIDLAMLVVAADDSVMPQTREHFEILKLLGLRHGLVALTKCDLVDETTLAVVELEIRELVRDSFLENAAIVRTSAHVGTGIAELRTALAAVSARIDRRPDGAWFRLAIDRAFVVQGHGTVITGSATSGTVQVGDELEWQPRGERVRVRSLQNHGEAQAAVGRGQRAAINLAGVRHEDVLRGQELATPGYLVPSDVLTVRLRCLPSTTRPLRHREAVRVHLGTAEIMGTVALLEGNRARPGEWQLGQLYLEQPTTAVWGQPFILREAVANHTLGGGLVLQPVARKIRRRHVEVIERIRQLWTDDLVQRVLAVAWFRGAEGVTLADVVRCAGLAPEEARGLLDQLRTRGSLLKIAGGPRTGEALVPVDVVQGLEEQALAVLSQWHEQAPFLPSHERQRLLVHLTTLADEGLAQCAVDLLLQEKRVVGDRQRVARADFRQKMSNSLVRLKDKIVAAYKEAGFRPPPAKSFVGHAGGNADHLDDLFALCVTLGELIHVKDDVYLHREVEAELHRVVAAKLANGPMTTSELSALLGAGRKNTILLCEYLDDLGITRRVGDVRTLVGEGVNHDPTRS